MHIEALLVGAVGPGNYVRGPQERGLGDAGERTASAPIVHKGVAKQILADALDDEPLGLRRPRQLGVLRAEAQERCVGQANSELVDAVERGVKLGHRLEDEGGSARTRNGRRRRSTDLGRLVLGASSDNGHVQFNTSSELGTINADTWPFVQGVGVYIDQPSGDVAPSGVLALTRYTGLYTTDTFDVTSQLSVTFGGRYNIAQIGLRDTLGNNAGLNGDHGYSRLNPVIGATFKVTPNVTAYAGYSEANRAPTPLELGCSDPLRPCLLDNALVGDPPLRQVVSHTYEAGLRGQHGDSKQGLFTWNLGVFHAENTDDIINVASPLPGHRYFQNGGDTLRRGMEVGAALKSDRWNLCANYTRVDATFQNALVLSSPNNPFADANGNIFVFPGDHIPAVPLQGRSRGQGH